MQDHCSTRWTLLCFGWTGGFGAPLYGGPPDLSGLSGQTPLFHGRVWAWSCDSQGAKKCYRPGTVHHQDKQTSSFMSHESCAADPSSLSNPRVSECLIGIIKRGYLLQFARRPPHFSSVVSTSVQTENAHVLCSEVMILLEKGAIEIVPPAQSESGFYSHYFLDPKKDGGPRPILDLRCPHKEVDQADHIETDPPYLKRMATKANEITMIAIHMLWGSKCCKMLTSNLLFYCKHFITPPI